MGAEDRLLGTSAGAVVGAQLAGELTIEKVYEPQRQGVTCEVAKGLTFRMIWTMTRDGLRSMQFPASCAIPLIWPTVTVNGHHYMEGGMRSPVNLDLAPGTGPVIALAATTLWQRWGRFSDQRRAVEASRPPDRRHHVQGQSASPGPQPTEDRRRTRRRCRRT